MIKKLLKISLLKFVYYNFLSKKVNRCGKGYLIPYRGAVIEIGRDSKINIHDGNLHVGYNKPRKSRAEAYLLLRENACLDIKDSAFLCYGATIELHNNSLVEIGSSYINVGAIILSDKKISIGRDVLISRDVFIYDSDHHDILNTDGEVINKASDVIIEDHVWLGLKTTVLRGAVIHKGAVISTDSVVSGKIKEGCMAQGNPARVYSTIEWRD